MRGRGRGRPKRPPPSPASPYMRRSHRCAAPGSVDHREAGGEDGPDVGPSPPTCSASTFYPRSSHALLQASDDRKMSSRVAKRETGRKEPHRILEGHPNQAAKYSFGCKRLGGVEDQIRGRRSGKQERDGTASQQAVGAAGPGDVGRSGLLRRRLGRPIPERAPARRRGRTGSAPDCRDAAPDRARLSCRAGGGRCDGGWG